MRIYIEVSAKKYESLKRPASAALSAALSFLKKKNSAVEVYLLTNKEMSRLNKRLRGRTGATNVISLQGKNSPRPDLKGVFLGEVFISPAYIKSRGESLFRILIHGLLHTLGYTHGHLRDRIKMEALENRIEAHLRTKKIYL